MTKRTRTFLFFGLAFLFFLTAPSVALYSQGYRMDWEAKRVTQIGALSFKVSPPRAEVSVDGKAKEKTAFLFGTALVENLFPKQYLVRVEKERYHPWEKILEVQPKRVTEAHNITLIPADVRTRALVGDVDRFWAAPDGKKAIFQKKSPERTWALTVWNFETGVEYAFFEPASRKQLLLDVAWSPDGEKVLVHLRDGEEIRNFVQEVDRERLSPVGFSNPASLVKYELEFLGQNVRNIRFSPANDQTVYFLSSTPGASALWEANYMEGQMLSRAANNVVTFAIEGDAVYWLGEKGLLLRKVIGGAASAESLNVISFPLRAEIEYEILPLQGRIFLRETEKVFLLDAQTGEFKEIQEGFSHMLASPDGRKIALANNSELWVYYLENQQEQPQRQAGDRIFLTRFSQKVENLSWLDSHHILFSVGNTIKVTETDNRGGLNIADIAVLPSPILFWDDEQKILYVLSEGTLYATEKLIR